MSDNANIATDNTSISQKVREVSEKLIAKQASENPTVVENNVTSLNEQEVVNELARLWAKHDTDLTLNRDLNAEVRNTQQERLRKFLVEAYPQALELIKPANRDLLNKLIRDKMMATPSSKTAGLFVQIAALQIGKKNKKGEFKTPARREERYGQLFRIFSGKKWAPKDLGELIVFNGGTSKIVNDDLAERRKDVDQQRENSAKEAYADNKYAPSVTVAGADVSKGKWRLALVSVHADQVVSVRSFVGKEDDAATKRAVAAYTSSGAELSEALQNSKSREVVNDDEVAAQGSSLEAAA